MPTKSNASFPPSPSDTSAPSLQEWERSAAALKPFYAWCDKPENQAAYRRWLAAYNKPDAKAARNKVPGNGYDTNLERTPEERFFALYYRFWGLHALTTQQARKPRSPDQGKPVLNAISQRDAIAAQAMLLFLEAEKPGRTKGQTPPLTSFLLRLSKASAKISRKEVSEKAKAQGRSAILDALRRFVEAQGRLPSKGELEVAAFGKLSEGSQSSRRTQFNRWLRFLGLDGLPERKPKPRERGAVRVSKKAR